MNTHYKIRAEKYQRECNIVLMLSYEDIYSTYIFEKSHYNPYISTYSKGTFVLLLQLIYIPTFDMGQINDKHEMRNSKQLDTLSDYDRGFFFLTEEISFLIVIFKCVTTSLMI